MRLSNSFLAASAAISSAGLVAGSTVRYCPGNGDGVCYGVGVPTSTAESGSGNIYFQIEAPTSYQWVALGPGSSMSNSYIFIMYQDGKGNVTISPRQGTFHSPPQLDSSSSAAKLTILAGSGVSSDGETMTANVMCSNCESLSKAKISPSSTGVSWIAAWRSGSSYATTSTSKSIDQHDDTAEFQIDLTKATVSTDSNPFVAASGGSGDGDNSGGDDSGGDSDGGDSSGGSNGGSGSGSSGGDSGGDGGVTVISDTKIDNTIMFAHGIVMTVVMVAIYPIGSILMPLVGKWLAHAAFQMIGFVLMWVGFGLGLKAAMDRSILFQQPHTILGTVVVCGLLLQPALGLIHHRYYIKGNPQPIFRYGHIWYGRLLIVLGIVNGGLGLELATANRDFILGYAITAAGIFVIYLIVKVLKSRGQQIDRKRERNGAA